MALVLLLFGCGYGPIKAISEGSRELDDARGRVTARNALALVRPIAQEISSTPVLLLVTSGSDIDAEGRSAGWEFVFHFPDRSAQAVYSFEPSDPEVSESPLRIAWRISPRADAKGEAEGLPLDFTDSPDAARRLSAAGVDWVAGDPDMTFATKRLPSGEAVWAVESYGREFTIPFAQARR